MSGSSDKTLIVRIKGSPTLAILLALLHGGAIAIALTLPVPLWARLGVAVVLGVSLYNNVNRHALRRGAQAVRALEFYDGQYALRLNSGELRSGCALCAWHVHPWIVILRLRCPGRRVPVNLVLTADAVEPETFRRLRVQLRAHVPAT